MFILHRYITFINSVFVKMWLTGIYGPIASVIHPLISWSYNVVSTRDTLL